MKSRTNSKELALMPVIATRLRTLMWDRRCSPRRKVQYEISLEVGVSVPNERLDPDLEQYPIPIMGHTRDISETGLSLVLPSLQLGSDHINVAGYPLRIVLRLPIGVVIVHTTTVRCEEFNDQEGRRKYLLGVAIKSMSDYERARFAAYLRTLREQSSM